MTDDEPAEAAARRRLELPKNVLASGFAWSWGAIAFNNLDVLRVRWQVTPGAAAQHEGSVLSFARQVVAEEGFLRGLCLPGVTANVAFCTVNGAVRLGVYPVASVAAMEQRVPSADFQLMDDGAGTTLHRDTVPEQSLEGRRAVPISPTTLARAGACE